MHYCYSKVVTLKAVNDDVLVDEASVSLCGTHCDVNIHQSMDRFGLYKTKTMINRQYKY